MNPVEEFLTEYGQSVKTAAEGGRLSDILHGSADQLAIGAATAGTAGIIAGIGVGASRLYNAVTKGRDFRKMLEFNEDLAAQHAENPKYVNAAFSTLRSMNASFSKDPMVAGSFVRQMVNVPEAAFGLAGQAAGAAPRSAGAVEQAAMSGLGMGMSRHK